MSTQLPILDEELPYYDHDPYAILSTLFPKGFDREFWRGQLKELVKADKTTSDQSMWDIGDLFLLAEVWGRLDEQELEREAEKVGKAWKTVRNYKVVSRAFPKDSALRRDGLSYSLYTLLTKFHEGQDKKIALDRAEELQSKNPKRRLTVDEFKGEIKLLQRTGKLPADAEPKKGEDGKPDIVTVKVEGPLRQETFDRLEAVAFKRYGKHAPNLLIWDMAFKYWADHKDQLETMCKDNDPQLKKENPLP